MQPHVKPNNIAQKYRFFRKFASVTTANITPRTVAKKTTKTKRRPTVKRKPAKKQSGETDWTWRILCILFIITIIAIILYYTCRKEVQQVTRKVVAETENIVKPEHQSKTESEETPKTQFTAPTYTDLEIPEWESSTTESNTIRHTGYTVSFNPQTHLANWVAYELTKAETAGSEKRTNTFTDDPYADGICATNSDYSRSGYDKGHMAPAGDMKWSCTAMKESFYFTNICPQKPELNRGTWKKLEDTIRQWAEQDSAIVIVCGPLYNKKKRYIGKNKIAVPDAFFKVIASPYIPQPRAIGFIFPNTTTVKDNIEEYAVTVDSVEAITGMDFFSKLPDNIENRIESTCNSKWR